MLQSGSMFQVSRRQLHLDQHAAALPLLLVDVPTSPSVTTMFLANTGSRYERAEQEGLAHFFEHMVFKGSRRYPTAQQLSTTLDSVGADFNAFTSKEYTGYYVKAAVNHLPLAIDVLSDMLFAPLLRQADIDREKGVIIEELNMYKDNPAAHVGDVFDELFFSERGLAHQIVGRKETIRSFNSEDFRQFISDFYQPENLLLVVVGPVAQFGAKLDELLAQAVGKIELSKSQQPPTMRVTARNTSLSELAAQKGFGRRRFKLIKRDSNQAHFVLAWPSLSTHSEERYALQLLSTIIGGNMSSRLFSQVREERGLAYYVNSSVDFYHDAGAFACSAGVDLQRAAEAIRVSRAVFEELASGAAPITAEELRRAQEYLRGKTLLSLESGQSVAQFFGLKQLLRADELSVDEVLARLAAVTLPQLQQLAAQLLTTTKPRLAIIGDFDGAAEKALRATIN